MHHCNHINLTLAFPSLKSIWLLVSYISRATSFILTQFFVLNFDGWSDTLSSKFIICWYSIIIPLYWSIIWCLLLRCTFFFWNFYWFFFCLRGSLWIILEQTLCNSICDFITNQIAICFYCFLNYSFWYSFSCICRKVFRIIKTSLIKFFT